jgi:hypothetical protein
MRATSVLGRIFPSRLTGWPRIVPSECDSIVSLRLSILHSIMCAFSLRGSQPTRRIFAIPAASGSGTHANSGPVPEITQAGSGGARAGRGELRDLLICACGPAFGRAYRPDRRRGRVAEGGGLLNRYRLVKVYRGFESLRLRQKASIRRPTITAQFADPAQGPQSTAPAPSA